MMSSFLQSAWFLGMSFQSILWARFADQGEKCREVSLSMTLRFSDLLPVQEVENVLPSDAELEKFSESWGGVVGWLNLDEVDGRSPANHLGCINLVNIGINYQPQQV